MKKLLTLTLAMAGATSMWGVDFAGGDGSAANPYQIATAEQMQAMSDNVTAHYVLVDDIDLDGFVWDPVGQPNVHGVFTGTLNGQGHTISNFCSDAGGNGMALFCHLGQGAVVENFTVKDADLVVGNWSGIIAASNGNWEHTGGTIRNVDVRDSYITGITWIGGICGGNVGVIENCRCLNVSVEGTQNYIGGIVGGMNEVNTNTGASDGYVDGCTFYGSVSGGSETGGITGPLNLQSTNHPAIVSNCAVYGNVSATGNSVGGITSQTTNYTNDFGRSIENCAMMANLTGGYMGGIGSEPFCIPIKNCYVTGNLKVTYVNGDPWSGGISACCYDAGKMTDCYFSGTIASTADGALLGAIQGRAWYTNIYNCYYNEECGATDVVGEGWAPPTQDYTFTKLLPEQMLNMASFNFAEPGVWQNIEGETTPFFTNQTAPLKINECTTDEISGLCSPDLQEIYIYASQSESIYAEPVINNGTWTVALNPDDVIEGETVKVIGFDAGKMPSMISQAKVVAASGIKSVAAEAKGKLEVDGSTVTFPAESSYSVCNMAGAFIASGIAQSVSLADQEPGIYLVQAAGQCVKVAVK